MLSLRLLGQVVLSQDDGQRIKFRSQKEAALLIYLAHMGQTHNRETIADLLWQASSTKQALANLRTALARARAQVDSSLVITRKTLAVEPQVHEQVDAVALLRALRAVDVVSTAETAVSLRNTLDSYKGSFLADFYLNDAPQFNEWVVMTREHIRQAVTDGYGKLAQYALHADDYQHGLTDAKRWVAFDELNEAAHAQLIQLLIKAGQSGAALSHYDRVVDLLKRELGITPQATMSALVEPLRPKAAPVLRDPATVPNNLPAAYDQFFGRIQAQLDINERLDQPWCRLVTILGQGGVGKTRLSLTVANNRLVHYPDGVWFIELADVDPNDDNLPEAIAIEIATSLDLRLSGNAAPIKQLISHLQHKQMLLVLDNFEHVLDGAPLVMEIVKRTKAVQLVASSREALNLRSEWTIDLTGLPTPAADDDETPSVAVALFEARFAQSQRGQATEQDLQAMRRICRLVKGVPLAIELAAALTHGASCRDVADRLANSFDVLQTRLRDVPLRHRSLRIVFDTSWQMLTPELQQQLARLSVFRGGFTVDAAQQVADADRWHLAALRDKSLLSQAVGSERFVMHMAVREFSAEKHPPSTHTQQRHSNYYLQFLAERAQALQRDAPQVPTAAIHAEIDNLRAAWQLGLATAAKIPIAALDALSSYYQLRGLSHEAEGMMAKTVSAAASRSDAGQLLASRAAVERARFQIRLGRYPLAIQSVKKALQLAKKCDDSWADGMAHILWGEALWRQGEYVSAETKLTHASKIANTINATTLTGWCHHHFGIIYDLQSDYIKAIEHLEQACKAWSAISNAQALSSSLNSIGLVSYHQGDLRRGLEAIEQAYTISHRLNNRQLQTMLLNNLAMIATEQNNYEDARRYLEEALDIAKSSGDLYSQGIIYSTLGQNAHKNGSLLSAIQLLKTSKQLCEMIGDRLQTAWTNMLLADVLCEQSLFSQAEPLYEQSVLVAQQVGAAMLECKSLLGIAMALKTTDLERTHQCASDALKVANTMQNVNLQKLAQEVLNSLTHASTANEKSSPNGQALSKIQVVGTN